MKKIMFLITLLSVLTSCNKDSSNPIISQSGLVGTWILTNISGTTPQGSITVSPGLVGISMTMVLNNNNTATLTTVQQGQTTTQNFTWIDLNSTIVFTPTNGEVIIPLPYTKTGNKINVGYSSLLPSITYNGVTITSLILEFTR
jgi:hypothetical protein